MGEFQRRDERGEQKDDTKRACSALGSSHTTVATSQPPRMPRRKASRGVNSADGATRPSHPRRFPQAGTARWQRRAEQGGAHKIRTSTTPHMRSSASAPVLEGSARTGRTAVMVVSVKSW